MSCCIQHLAGKLCEDPTQLSLPQSAGTSADISVQRQWRVEGGGFCWRVRKFTVSPASNQTSPAQTS